MSNYVNLLDIVYPVGSIYHSMNSTSPAASIGGTWTAIKTFLLGSTTSGKAGGEEAHVLTINEMPAHSHEQYVTANIGNESVRSDYSSDQRGLIYPQGCYTGATGGASTQQYAALHDLLHLVQNSLVVLKANLLSEVAYV